MLGGLSIQEKSRVGTVLRLVGDIYAHNVTANAQSFGRWGIHLLTDDAMAAGTVLEPLTDHQADWMWNEHIYADSSTVALDPFRKPLDIRSKRRIPNLFTLAFVMEISSAANGALDWALGLRVLYLVK